MFLGNVFYVLIKRAISLTCRARQWLKREGGRGWLSIRDIGRFSSWRVYPDDKTASRCGYAEQIAGRNVSAVLLSGKLRAEMASDPSIHVDLRIKESTSCKTVNRYYEEKRREGEEGGGLGAILKPSSSGDVILGNSQPVTLFLFFAFPPFLLPQLKIQSKLANRMIKRIAMTFGDNSKKIHNRNEWSIQQALLLLLVTCQLFKL